MLTPMEENEYIDQIRKIGWETSVDGSPKVPRHQLEVWLLGQIPHLDDTDLLLLYTVYNIGYDVKNLDSGIYAVYEVPFIDEKRHRLFEVVRVVARKDAKTVSYRQGQSINMLLKDLSFDELIRKHLGKFDPDLLYAIYLAELDRAHQRGSL